MKLSKVFKVTFLAVGFMLLSFGYSSASLTQLNPLVDTTTNLSIQWHWVPEISSSAVYGGTGTNWNTTLNIISIPGGSYNFEIVNFQHLFGPHTDDINPGPIFSSTFTHDLTSSFTYSGDWNHPTTTGQMHHDLWTFSFDAASNNFKLEVAHTPIPATLLLFSSGLLGLFGIGRKRLFMNE
jgi:hypothetical protein